MRILFMGTPDYAAVTLQKLIDKKYELAAVFAQPDKPVGRKHILTPPPVKVLAEENGIKVYQPNTLRDGSATEILKELSPDVIVVVAYGKLLPKEVLDIPKYETINSFEKRVAPLEHIVKNIFGKNNRRIVLESYKPDATEEDIRVKSGSFIDSKCFLTLETDKGSPEKITLPQFSLGTLAIL